MQNNHQFKIFSINCQSIASDDKKIMLNRMIKDHRPDVVTLNETWLKRTSKLIVSNYKIFRLDRSSTGGGVAVVVQKKIETRQIMLPLFNSIEAVGIQLLHQDGSNTTIVSLYRKPAAGFIQNEWDTLWNALPDQRTIIAGDMNCRSVNWKCSATNREGDELETWTNMNELTICAASIPSRGTENLDLFLCSDGIDVIGRRLEMESLPFPSDHNVVVLKCKMASRCVLAREKSVLNWKTANVKEFPAKLDEKLINPPIWEDQTMGPMEIELAVCYLTGNFAATTDECIRSHICSAKFEENIAPSTSALIIRLREDRATLHHLKRRNVNGRHNLQIAALTNSIKHLAIIVRQLVQLNRKDEFTRRCQRIRPGPNMFQELKKVANYKNFEPVPMVLEKDGEKLLSRDEQIEAMADNFEKIHHEARDNIEVNRRIAVETAMEERFGNYVPTMEFSEEFPACLDGIEHHSELFLKSADIMEIVRRLNNKVSKGADMVPNRLLRIVGPRFVKLFTIVINQMINCGYTPKDVEVCSDYSNQKAWETRLGG